jgi:hypothetical protein
LGPQQFSEFSPEHLPLVQDSLEVRSARSALLELAALHRLHGLRCRARERAEGAGVQVGVAVQHRKFATNGDEIDVITPKSRTAFMTAVKTIDQAEITSRASAAGM